MSNLYRSGMKGLVALLILSPVAFVFQNCSVGFSTADVTTSSSLGPIALRMDRAGQPLPSGFGTALQNPRYNPVGERSNAFVDGARDAYYLGIQTLKIFMGPNAYQQKYFYFLPEAETSKVKNLVDMAHISSYKTVLEMPFKTIFINNVEMAAFSLAFAQTEITPAQLDAIYKENYDLSLHLLNSYRGSGKTFVLQNWEGDWLSSIHNGSGYSDNTPIGITNFIKYWNVRQKAVNDARKAVKSDVAVYHMCEVVRVIPGWKENKPSLTRDALPHVTCDLVGYSSYESALVLDGGATFQKSFDYIKQHAKPSEAFGSSNVIVSEIGVPEGTEPYGAAYQDQNAAIVHNLLVAGVPYVLYWNMYDNECRSDKTDCSSDSSYQRNLSANDMAGYWIRRPDGSLGGTFQKILSSFGLSIPTGMPAPSPVGLSQQNQALPVVIPTAEIKSLYDLHLPGCWTASRQSLWEQWFANGGKLADFTVTLHSEAMNKPSCLNTIVSANTVSARAPATASVVIPSTEVKSLFNLYLPGCWTQTKQSYWQDWFARGGLMTDFTITLRNEALTKPSCMNSNAVPTSTPAPQEPTGTSCPANASGYAVGQTISCACKSTNMAAGGAIYGTSNYTADSNLCKAAQHAGKITSAGGGIVAYVTSGHSSYAASSQHGVTSVAWGSYGASFNFVSLGNGGQLSNNSGQLPTQTNQERMNDIQLNVYNNYNVYLPGCWTPSAQTYWEAWFARGGTLADFMWTLQTEAAKRPACMN